MLDRREFLKVGAAASFVTLSTLAGCGDVKEKFHDQYTLISFIGLQKYDMLFCNDEVMMVRYEPIERAYLTVTKLEVLGDHIEEVEIYKEMINDYENVKGDFYSRFDVTKETSAYDEFKYYCGDKDYYTVEEINYVFDCLQKENCNNKQKTLVK